MINYKKILVFENDSERIGLPVAIDYIEKAENRNFEVWWDFSSSFHWDREAAFKRLSEINNETLVLSNPSFVGPGNSFSGYLGLFLKMKELGIKLNLAITYYPDSFFMYLLKFLYEEQNYLKKENNHRMLKEVLDYHNIYEIDMSNIIGNSNGVISNSYRSITWQHLMFYYYETHRKNRAKLRIRATGEIYDAYYVNYHADTIDDMYITLMIPDDYNNKYKLTELERC